MEERDKDCIGCKSRHLRADINNSSWFSSVDVERQC